MSQENMGVNQEQLSALANAQSQVLDDLRHVIPEIIELWQRVGVMLEDAYTRPGHPMRRAEYMTQGVSLDVLLQSAARNLAALGELEARVRDVRALEKLKTIEHEATSVNRDKFKALLEPESAHVLKADFDTLKSYLPSTGANLAAALTAVYAPLVGIRELLLAFAHEPSGGKDKLELLLEVIKAVGVDHLSLYCPLIGPAVAVAETLKKQVERRANELNAGIEERDRFLALDEGIEAFQREAAHSKEVLAKALGQADELDKTFLGSVHRVMGTFRIVGEI